MKRVSLCDQNFEWYYRRNCLYICRFATSVLCKIIMSLSLNSKSLWTCPTHGNKRTSKTGGHDQSLHKPRNSPQDHFIKHSCGVTARRGNGPETTPILYLIERPECRREGRTDFHPLNCKTESVQSSGLLHMEGAYRPSNCLLMLMVLATVSIRWDWNAAACTSVETRPTNGMLGAGIAVGYRLRAWWPRFGIPAKEGHFSLFFIVKTDSWVLQSSLMIVTEKILFHGIKWLGVWSWPLSLA
jgi:hypothetical protein